MDILLLAVVYGIFPFAGTDFGGDGRPATETQLIQPQGIAVDKDGSIVFADAGEHRVRRISPNGFVSTIAGDGIAGGGSRLRAPYGVAIGPDGAVYVADLGNARVLRIRKDGSRQEFTGFKQPRNVALDPNGVLYVSDFGADAVLRLRSNGTFEPAITEKVKAPAALTFGASGTLYIADSGNQRVVAIQSGVARVVLKDFGAVTSIAVDRGARLYAAGGDRVAMVTPSGDITILNTAADEVALDVYGSLITSARRQLRSYQYGITTILAGNPMGSFVGDARPPEEWRFLRPTGIVREGSGNLYISDSDNGGIRRIDTEGALSTRVASLGEPAYLTVDGPGRVYFSDTKTGVIHRLNQDGKSEEFSRGSGTKPFLRPSGLAHDHRGQLFVADTGNGLIRKVFEDGFVTTVAGGGDSDGDGYGTSVALKRPVGIALSAEGDVWFTDMTRLRVLRTNGKVITLPDIPLTDARGIRFDRDGYLFVADAGSQQILRVNVKTGEWQVAAGVDAGLNAPTDVWPEADGSVLICDSGNNRIRLLKPVESAPVTTPVEPPTNVVAVTGPIQNEDGSSNTALNPSARTGILTLQLTGLEIKKTPLISAEIASLELPVITTELAGERWIVTIQLTGGFLPSGTVPLVLRVNETELAAPVNVSIR